MFNTLPYKIFDVNCVETAKTEFFRHIAFNKVLLSKYVKRQSEIEVPQSNQTVITQHAKRE